MAKVNLENNILFGRKIKRIFYSKTILPLFFQLRAQSKKLIQIKSIAL